MSRKRKSNSRRPSGADGMIRIKDASRELGPLLQVLDEICEATRRSLINAGPVGAGFPAFDRALLNRGLNLLEAIRVLAVPLHWEAASSSARQMYELVLNMEALAAMPDREEASFQFGLFGLMQKARARVVEYDYARASGRSIDEGEATAMKEYLDGDQFKDFKVRTKPDGTVVWAKSWTGKTTWELANSSPKPIRVPQYNLLFIAWSEETHGTPASLMNSMFRTGGAAWAEDFHNNDLREMTQILLMAIHQFLELWTLLLNVPPVDRRAWSDWFSRINDFLSDRWKFSVPLPEFEK